MNELTTQSNLPITSFADMKQVGNELAKSCMFGVKNEAQGVALLVTSLQTGMPIFEINRKYHIMHDGKMSMKADAMLAEFKRLGGKCKWVKFDATEARAVWSYGENEGLEVGYTIEEAKQAGLVKESGAWKANPADMLRARLITKVIRMICPEVNHGVYTPEEVADFAGGDAGGDVKAEPKPVEVVVEEPKPEPKLEVEDAEEVVEDVADDSSDAFDYGVCPVKGKLFGKRWDEMPEETLKLALKLDDPMMEPEHYEAVKAVLANKGE